MEPTLIFWIIACIAFILIEAITQQLVAVWFVVGSACSLLVSLFDVSFDHQIIIFIIVSLLTLIALRPLLKKFMSGQVCCDQYRKQHRSAGISNKRI